MTATALSVVVPVYNEAENIRPQVQEIMDALRASEGLEIIYVDDCSDDDTLAVLVQLTREVPQLRALSHSKNCGQSTAIYNGVLAARNPWIATLDGDGQNDPADIPRLYDELQAMESAARCMITGWRQKRRDNWSRRLSSRLANQARQILLRDDTPDSGCGLKLFSRALFLRLPYFDHMHRFLPALVVRAGGQVFSRQVSHRPRKHGVSKYGCYGLNDRLWAGLVDLVGVLWLMNRVRRVVVTEHGSADAKLPAPITGRIKLPR